MDLISQSESATKLSTDIETPGLDTETAKKWIYPTNYSLRDYQFNIIQKALMRNTLVSLPTGLGKTFIAAVVMFNFYRWYPVSKIVFMAPTRPLVKQQVDACYDIMAIPKDVTAELTGTKLSASRADIWAEKRVFFVTPQVLQNDLESIPGLGAQIRCIVFDEAHKARGNYAYCEVIRRLKGQNRCFRVLALSATPGNSVQDVQEVASNLLISHLEFRIEESMDVRSYVFKRSLETVVVQLGDKLQEIKDEYLKVLECFTKPLLNNRVIYGNCSMLSKGKIFLTMKDYQQRSRGAPNYSENMRALNICVTLYHGFELLIRHGLRGFLSYFDEHINKPLLKHNAHIMEIMENVRTYLGPAPNIEPLPDGSFAEIPADVKFGHPKFYKLREILVKHFSTTSDATRVIVFFEYRESVKEAYALLLQSMPLIKPRLFLGQGSGITQRNQLNVIKAFRDGHCNTLLSTCIGEEGLDVGDVDLIICFDISNKSPIRMVQRMGRTGRKKQGQIIVMVTEGKEQQTLKDCLIYKNNVAQHVMNSSDLKNSLYGDNARLLPSDLLPVCEKLFITVPKPTLSKKSTIKDLFKSFAGGSKELVLSQEGCDIQGRVDRIPEVKMYFNKVNLLDKMVTSSLKPNLEKQRILQATYKIKHSKSSELLVNLLQIADSKRFNIPASHAPLNLTQLSQNRNLKQGDIRSMFARPAPALPLTISQEIIIIHDTEPELPSFTEDLFTEISDYVTIQLSLANKTKCKFCPPRFDCTKNVSTKIVNFDFVIPDLSILNKPITLDDLRKFDAEMKPTAKVEDPIESSLNDDLDELFESSKINAILNNSRILFPEDEKIVEETVVEDSLNFAPPDSFRQLFGSTSIPSTTTEKIEEPVKQGSISPDLFESPERVPKTADETNYVSPILCSQNYKKRLQYQSGERPNWKRLKEIHSPANFTLDNSKLCSTPKSSVKRRGVLNMSRLLEEPGDEKKQEAEKIDDELLEVSIDDIIDISTVFDKPAGCNEEKKKSHSSDSNLVTIDDIVDTTIFERSEVKTNKCSNTVENQKSSSVHCDVEEMDIDDIFDVSVHLTQPKIKRIREKLKEPVVKYIKSVVGYETVNTSDLFNIDGFFNDCLESEKVESQPNEALTKSPSETINISSDSDLTDIGDIIDLPEIQPKNPVSNTMDFDLSDILDTSEWSRNDPTIAAQVNTVGEEPHVPASSANNTTSNYDAKSSQTKSSEFLRKQSPRKSNEKQSSFQEEILDRPSTSHTTQLAKRPNESKTEQVSEYCGTKEDSYGSSQETIINMSQITRLTEQFRAKTPEPIDTIDLTQDSPVKEKSQIFNLDLLNSAQKCNTSTPIRKSKLSTNKNANFDPKLFKKSLRKVKEVPVDEVYKSAIGDVSLLDYSVNLLNHQDQDSDNDFEEPPWISRKKKKRKPSFEFSKPSKVSVKRKPKKAGGFIASQAELSEDDCIVSEDEDESNLDDYDASFVEDEITHSPDKTQVYLNYIQSTRSPIRRRGGFKIPEKPRNEVSFIYSQAVEPDVEDYGEEGDSFVVDEEDDQISEQAELSELDILEMKLKEMKRAKRRHKNNQDKENLEKPVKRRRILILSDSD